MATASPEHLIKAATHTEEYNNLLCPDEETDSPSGQLTTAAGSDSDSSKEDIPHDDQPKAKPRAFSVDPSESSSLNSFHYISPKFKNYIDISALHNYLKKHCLLTRGQSATLALTTINDIDKINRLIEWLPQKGPRFLDKFIECLRDSATSEEGLSSHGELANLLENTRQEAEKQLREFGERAEAKGPNQKPAQGTDRINERVDPETVVASGAHVEYTPTQKGSPRQKYFSARCLVSLTLSLAVAILLVIIVFVLLAQLPQFKSDDISPQHAQPGLTMELSFGISTKLLAGGSLGIDGGCNGYLYIISGVQCPDLYDEYTSYSTIDDQSFTFYSILYYWLLPGSRIEYTLNPNAHAEVWLFSDESFYTDCNDVLTRECSDYPQICYQFHNPLETPANRTIQINESGNYFQCFNQNPPEQIDNVNVYVRSYNIMKLNEEFGHPIKISNSENFTPFSFNNSFLCFPPSCVLYHVDECLGFAAGISGSVSRRFDVVFFGGIVLFIVLVVFAILVSVCLCRTFVKNSYDMHS